MRTITRKISDEIIVNKSKFITILYPIINDDEINKNLIEIKNEYTGATHYCFAYIVNGKEKCSDDGEPSGTAGTPILNILKNNDLTNVLCVVVRYFGGIKLGAGGLVRAYANSVKEALNKCSFGILVPGYEVTIEFDYDNIKSIDYILKNIDVVKKFDDKVIYKFKIEKNVFDGFLDNIKMYSDILHKEEIVIIKDDN
ncbi:MAG: YigZ family protein [Bacilli bacterium]|nr:YigZ family protein [Bacilli bacterium]